MRNLVIAVAALAAVAAAPAVANDRYGKQKVVYHVNQPGGESGKGYLAALGNVRNHVAAVGKDDIEVSVVMHGDGVGLLQEAKSNEKLQGSVVELKSQNVRFLVCRNTLTGRKIDPDKDLFDVYAEDIVPSGVAELSHLQKQGYTYVRP